MADTERMFIATMTPEPEAIRKRFYDKLLRALADKHADEIVITKGQRRNWYHKYQDSDLVKIVTAKDDAVCQMCIDLASHNPFRYGDAKKALPHHWGCRCQIASLNARDEGFLRQATFKKVKKYIKTSVKDAIKQRGKKVSQRGATIKKLRKRGTRFVAPSGYRVVARFKKGKK